MITTKNADGTYDLPIGSGYVGAEILEIISGALYKNPLDVLREYVQNAVDAEASEVRIQILETSVAIRDNGRGMDLQGLDNARKIAVSEKDKENQVGFRGIGIYSSFSVCDRLEITTKTASSETAYLLTFDYTGIRDEIKEARQGVITPLSLVDVLKRFTHIEDAPSDPTLNMGEEAYTNVRLVCPNERFKSRLGEIEYLKDYLISAVPLDFSDDFAYSQILRQEIAKHVKGLRLIRVFVTSRSGEETLIVQPAPENVLPPTIKIITSPDTGRDVAFIWLSLNKNRGPVKPDNIRGLLVRLKGFAIGDRKFAQRFWGRSGYGVLYPWVTGEIYILDNSVTPTAERNDFEQEPSWDKLAKALLHELRQVDRTVDKRRNALVIIEKFGKAKATQNDVNNALKQLVEVRSELSPIAPVSREQLLDDKGEKILHTSDKTNDSNLQSNRRPRPQPKPIVHDHIQLDDAADLDAPNLIQLLLSTTVEWSEDAQQVLGIVDGVLQDDLEVPKYRACSKHIGERLQSWDTVDDTE